MSLFEIIYWAAMIAEMAIRAPINKQRKQQKISDQRISSQEKALLAILFFGMFILPLVYSASPWLDFASYSLPAWANWLGVALILGALVVFWRSHVDLGLNWSPSLEIREKHELITRGIYGLIRHPMYASQLLWVLAQPLLIPNWLAGVFGGMLFLPFYFIRVKAEEKMMLDSFGEQYARYMEKTGGVVPKFGK
jgi:protein-S-isoprenylcysteine O-methyltransferase Ste14